MTFYEFFAGAGLVRIALAPEWRCLWANDCDPRKGEVYTANFGSAEFELGDVAAVGADALPSGADMAWASFPCQDLSLAGWRRGMTARRSGTFWAFWRLMRDLHDRGDRPPLLVIENVAGLLYGPDFAGLCESLAALELQFGALVVDAKHFLPQSRPRVFIIAADAGIDLGAWTVPNPGKAPWFPAAMVAAQAGLPEAIRPLWRWWRLPAPQPMTSHVSDLIETQPEGVTWHSPQETAHLLAMMAPLHRGKVERACASGLRSVGLLYRRTRSGMQRAEIRFDGVAGCLRTPQGGSSRQTVMVIEAGEVRSRLLSPREAARLMGAPDSYRLPDHYNNAYRAMGDGVAVPVVQWLKQHLLNPIAQATRRHEPVSLAPRRSAAGNAVSSSRSSAEMLAGKWGSAPL